MLSQFKMVAQTIQPSIRVRVWLSDRQLLRLLLYLSDLLTVAVAFGLAYWLRFSVGIALSDDVTPIGATYIRLCCLLVPVWLLLFAALGLYDPLNLLGGTAEYVRALNACTVGIMLVVLVSFLFPTFVISRGWLVMAWALSCFLVCLGRLCVRRFVYRSRRRGWFVARALIVGSNQEASALATQLGSSASSGLAVQGVIAAGVDVQTPGMLVAGLPVLGAVDALPMLLDEHGIDEVVVATTALSSEQLMALLLLLTARPQVQLRLSSGLYEVLTTGLRISTRNSVPLATLNRLRLEPMEMVLKSLLDYLVILVALPLLLPIFAVIALLIKLDSPGPVFHSRRVLGINGRQFDAFKFRTMVVNGDEVLAAFPELRQELLEKHKLQNDPRVTNVGRWLRRFSLDELPQLVNVLLGQMSLVGPRMISPEEHIRYGRMRVNLLTVKPGLTGIWQVSGRSNLNYDQRVQLDMYYIRNYSIWLDIQILFFQTLPALLSGRGAY